MDKLKLLFKPEQALQITLAVIITILATGVVVYATTTISGSGIISGTYSGTWQGGTIGVAYGGTGSTTLTTNGVLYGGGSSLLATDQGTSGYVLQSVAGVPSWVATTSLGFGSGGGSGMVGSGLTGQVPYYTYNGTAVYGTSTIFLSSTPSVGIGTTTPTLGLLDVNGDIALENNGLLKLHEARINGSNYIALAATSSVQSSNMIYYWPGEDGATGQALMTSGHGDLYWGTASGTGSGSGTINSGTVGQIAYYNANDTAVIGTSTLFLTTTQRVGLGTTTANQQLTVFNNNNDAAIELSSASGANYKWTIGMDYSDGGKFVIASSSALGTNNRLMIDGNGNVGIGTTTPGSALDIYSNGNSWGNITSEARYPGIVLNSTDSDPENKKWGIWSGKSGTGSFLNFNQLSDDMQTGYNWLTVRSRSSLIAGTMSSIERVEIYGTIYFGGNVGIGTTSPEARLQVYSGTPAATSTIIIGAQESQKGACLKLRDRNASSTSWTYCTTLNGTLNCSTTSCE